MTPATPPAAVTRVRRRGTTLVPHRPVALLLANGPYRLSRNPMYTGLALTCRLHPADPTSAVVGLLVML